MSLVDRQSRTLGQLTLHIATVPVSSPNWAVRHPGGGAGPEKTNPSDSARGQCLQSRARQLDTKESTTVHGPTLWRGQTARRTWLHRTNLRKRINWFRFP
jgi:hypothetical protein